MPIPRPSLPSAVPSPQLMGPPPPPVGTFPNASLYVGDLDGSVNETQLLRHFNRVAPVVSVRVCRDSTRGTSLGYGYVNFRCHGDAVRAMETLNYTTIKKKPVRIMFSNRDPSLRKSGHGNVFIKNLEPSIDTRTLHETFACFGTVLSCKVATYNNGRSKGFAFVHFEKEDSAQRAIHQLNGMLFNGRKVYVGPFIRRQERNRAPKYEEDRRMQKFQGTNLFLKNFDDNFDDEKLRGFFSRFGNITSSKVMVDHLGHSKGHGFVAFSTPEEAHRAMVETNGQFIGGKPLYVALAQRKEERRAMLQAQYAQRKAHVPLGPSVPSMGYHVGAPRLGPEQVYYEQGTPGLIPPHPEGFGFQPQLIPGFQPSVDPNFTTPYHPQKQGQPGQPMGFKRGGRQQQMVRQNGGVRYMQNAQKYVEPSMPPQAPWGPVMPVPVNVDGMPMDAYTTPSIPIAALASALASATPENQHVMLGLQLYPLVERIERDHAGKVTGMLLELHQNEVLHLLESPEALRQKVSEAMGVLARASVEPQ